MGNISIVAHDLQLAQALGADDLIVAVDEHLGAQVHLLAAFGTGIVHIVVLLGYKGSVIWCKPCKNRAELLLTNCDRMSVKMIGLRSFFKKNSCIY